MQAETTSTSTAERSTSSSTPAPAMGAGATAATAPHLMRVKKRDGRLEAVNVLKIVERVTRLCGGLTEVDPHRVAIRAISGLYDGAPTKELDDLCIQTASLLIGEEPQYSQLAARLLSTYIDEEVLSNGVRNFMESIEYGFKAGILSETTLLFVRKHQEKLVAAINPARNTLFEYFGLRTVYDRYLQKDPQSRQVFETPQYFFMRVACGLAQSADEAIELYELMSKLDYMPSTPTLFNSATLRPQMSSVQRLNAVMKTLTMISTIFLPLNFIAGIYGMNFEHMPETKWLYGYPLAIATMAIVGALMIGFFIHKGWLWERRFRHESES